MHLRNALLSTFGVQGAKISVVIPTRDRARLVDAAIASVLASPLITSPTQIAVIDDDSHDDTEAVALKHGVRYKRVIRHNSSLTRNAGFELVQSPYVTFLDSDDAWLPGNMEPQLAALESNPKAAFAYGIARCTTENFQPIPEAIFPKPPLHSGLVPERLHLHYPQLGVVLFRREAVANVGGFDPRIPYYQDGDLMIRIAARHPIVGVNFVGMLHRLRDPSRTRSDYHWGYRDVRNWWPRGVGIGVSAAATLMIRTRSLLFHRFCEDTAACVDRGQRKDALVCLSRALRVSPAHAVRHYHMMASLLLRSLHQPAQRSSLRT